MSLQRAAQSLGEATEEQWLECCSLWGRETTLEDTAIMDLLIQTHNRSKLMDWALPRLNANCDFDF